MFRAFTLLLPLLSSAFALAAPQVSTPDLTCIQAASYVDSRGAVILGLGDGQFERVVSMAIYCEIGDGAYPMWVRTRDSVSCFVGYSCIPR